MPAFPRGLRTGSDYGDSVAGGAQTVPADARWNRQPNSLVSLQLRRGVEQFGSSLGS